MKVDVLDLSMSPVLILFADMGFGLPACKAQAKPPVLGGPGAAPLSRSG